MRVPNVGDTVEIHDFHGGKLNTASWHKAIVCEVRLAKDDEENIARIRCEVKGLGNEFWRRLEGNDLAWRWPT